MKLRGEGMSVGIKDVIAFPKYSNVLMHSECRKEIIQLIQPEEVPDFVAAYQLRIDYLSMQMGEEIFHRNWFEALKKSHGLRSIRFMKFRNLRILYVLDNSRAYLLLAFEERKGHKNTEYSRYINPALKRMDEREKML